MHKVGQEIYTTFKEKVQPFTEMLFEDSLFTVEEYLNKVKEITNSKCFRAVSKQDLFEEFIIREGIIPIEEILEHHD